MRMRGYQQAHKVDEHKNKRMGGYEVQASTHETEDMRMQG